MNQFIFHWRPIIEWGVMRTVNYSYCRSCLTLGNAPVECSFLKSTSDALWVSHLQSVDEMNSMEALLSATILLFSPLSSFTEQKLGIITTKNGSAYLISRTEQKLSATSNDYSLPLMYNVKGQYFSGNFGWDNGDDFNKKPKLDHSEIFRMME